MFAAAASIELEIECVRTAPARSGPRASVKIEWRAPQGGRSRGLAGWHGSMREMSRPGVTSCVGEADADLKAELIPVDTDEARQRVPRLPALRGIWA